MTRVVVEHLNKQFDGKPPTLAIDDLSIDVDKASSSCCSGRAGAARRRRCGASPGSRRRTPDRFASVGT